MLLTPRDLLVRSDEEAVLVVEAESRWGPFLDPARAGVEMEVDGHGRAVSGPDGLARLPLGRLPAGSHRLRVKAKGVEAEVLVRSAPKEAPVLITDIDHTIADVSPVGFILKSNPNVKPLAGAREALESLARRMEIVYLTARDHIYGPKTRAWLRLNAFPEAPLYPRAGTRFWTVLSKQHKIARLGELRARFADIRAGVGDLPGDAEAYAAHGIPPILIAPTKPAKELPAGTHWVRDWAEILDRLGR